MSFFNTQTHSRVVKGSGQRDFGDILRGSSQNRYANVDNLRESRSNEDLKRPQWGNLTAPLRVETKPQSKRTSQLSNTNLRNPSKENRADKAKSASNLNNKLLAEAADLEIFSDRLLDLVNGRLDNFMSSVKQFVHVSGRLAKCVYPKAPDVESVLKNFQSHKATLENNIAQMEKSIQRIGIESRTRSVSFNQLLKEGYLVKLIKEGDRKNPHRRKNQESTQVDDSSSDPNETSNDISSAMLDENIKAGQFDTLQEIQKLKSLVNNVEEKNNILLWKLDPNSPSQKQFYASGPAFFSVERPSEFARERNDRSVSPQQIIKNRLSATTDLTGALRPFVATQSLRTTEAFKESIPAGMDAFILEQINKIQEEDLKIREENARLSRQLESQLRNSVETKNRHTEELEIMNSDLKSKYNRLKELYEVEAKAHEDLKRTFETRDSNVAREINTMLGELRMKIQTFDEESSYLIEAQSRKRDASGGHHRGDLEASSLRKFIIEKLKDFENSLIRLGNFVRQSFGLSASRDNLAGHGISQENTGSLSRSQENFYKSSKIHHPHSVSYQEGVMGSISRSVNVPNSIKDKELSSPSRKIELDNMIDSVSKKKAEVYQSLRGLEDTMTHRGGSFSQVILEGPYNERNAPRRESLNREERYSIMREKMSYNEVQSQKEQEALRSKYKGLEDEYKALQEKYKGLERLFSEKTHALNTKIEDLRSRNKILMEQFSKDQDQKNKQIRELNEKLDTMTVQTLSKRNEGGNSSSRQHLQGWKEIQDKLAFYESTIEDLQRQNHILNGDNRKLNTELEKLYEEARKREGKETREGHSYREYHSVPNKEVRGQREGEKASPYRVKTGKELEEQEKKVSEEMRRQEETIMTLMQENEKLKQQLDQTLLTGRFQSEETHRQRESGSRSRERERLSSREIKTEEDMPNLKEELKEANKMLRIKTREYEESLKRFEGVRRELVEKENRVVELEEELKEKTLDYKALLDAYTRLEAEMNKYKEEVKNKSEQTSRQEEGTRALQEEFSRERMGLKGKIEELEKLLREKEDKQKRKLKEIERELEIKLGALLEESTNDQQRRLTQLTGRLSKCQENLKRIVSRVLYWKREAEDSRSELRRVSKSKTDLEQKLTQAAKDLLENESKYEELRANLDRYDNDVDKLQDMLKQANQDNTQIRDENLALIEKVRIFEGIKNGLQTQLTEAYTRIQHLSEAKLTKDSSPQAKRIAGEKDNAIHNLESALHNAREALNDKTNELNELLKAHNDAMSQITSSLNLTVIRLKQIMSEGEDIEEQEQELSLEGAFVVIEGLIDRLEIQNKRPASKQSEEDYAEIIETQRINYERQLQDKDLHIARLTNQLNAREKNLTDLLANHEDLMREYNSKEQAYDELKLLMDEELAQRDLKIGNLTKTLEQMKQNTQNEVESGQINKLKEEIARNKKEINELTMEVNRLTEKKELLESKLDDETIKTKQIEEEFRRRIELIQEERGNLEAEVIAEKEREIDAMREEYEEKLNQLTQENKSITELAEKHKNIVKGLQSEKEHLQLSVNGLKVTLENIRKERDVLAHEKEELKLEKMELKSSMQEAKSSLNDIQEENQTALQTIGSLEDRIRTLERTLLMMEQQDEEAKSEIRGLNAEKEGLMDRIHQLESEEKMMKNDMEILRGQHTLLLEKEQDLKKQMEKNDKANRQMAKEIETVNEKNMELTRILRGYETGQSQTSEKINNNINRESALQERINVLEANEEGYMRSIQRLEQERDQAQEKIDNLPQAEIEKMENNYKEKIAEFNKESERLQAKVRSLEQEKQQAEHEVQTLRENMINLEKEMKTLEDKNADLIENQNQLRNNFNRQLEELNEKRAEVKRMNDLLNEKGGNVAEIETHYKSLMTEMEQKLTFKETEIHELQTVVVESRIRVQELVLSVQSEEGLEDVGDLDSAFRKLEERVNEIKQKLKQAQDEKEKILKEHEGLVRELKNEVMIKTDTIETLKTRLGEEIDRLSYENQQIRTEIAYREHEKNRLVETLNGQIKSKETEIQNLKDERQAQEAEHGREIDGLKQEISTIKSELDEVTQRDEVREKENNVWQDKFKQEIESLQKLLEESRQREEALEHEREELESKVQNKEDIIRQAEENRKVSERQYTETKQKLEKELKEKEEEIRRIVDQYNAKERESKETQRKLKEELQKYKENIDLKEKDSSKVVGRLHEQLRGKEDELETLREETEMRINANKEVVRRLEKEIVHKGEEITKVKEERELQEKEYQNRIRELEEKVKNTEEEKKKKLERYSVKEKEDTEVRKGLEQQVKSLGEEVLKLQKENGETGKLREELDRLRKENEGLLEKQGQDYSRLEGELEKVKKDSEQKEKEHEEIQNRLLADLEKLAQDGESQIREQKEACRILEEKVEGLKQEKELVEKARLEELEKVGRLQEDLKSLEEEVGRLRKELKTREEQFDVEKRELSEKVEGKEEEIRRLVQDIERFKESLHTREEGEQGMRSVLKDRNKEIEELKEKLQKSQEEVLKKTNAMESLGETKDQEIKVLESDLVQRQEAIDNLTRSVEERENSIGELRNEIEARNLKIAEIQRVLNQVNEEKEDLIRQLKDKSDQISTLESQVETMKKENQLLSSSSTELERHIAQFRESLQEEKNTLERNLREVIESKEQYINKLTQQIQDTHKDYEIKLTHSQSLYDQLDRTHRETLQIAEDEKARRNVEINDLKKANEELNVEIESYKNTIGDLEGKLENILALQNESQRELEQVKGELSQTSQKLQETGEAKQVLENRLNEGTKAFEDITGQLAQLEMVRTDLERRIETLEAEKTNLNADILDLRKVHAGLNHEIERSNNAIGDLESKLVNAESLHKDTQKELEQVKEEVTKTTQKLQETQEAKEKIEASLAESQKTQQETREEFNQLEQIRNDLQIRLDASENEVRKLTEEVRVLHGKESSLEGNIGTYIKQIEELRTSENSQKNIQKELESQIQSLNKSLDAAKSEIQTKKQEIQELKHAFETHKHEIHTNFSQQTKEFEALKELRTSLENEINDLKEKLSKLESENTKKTEELTQKDAKVTKLTKELQTEKQAREKENQEHTATIESLNQEKKNFSSIRVKLQAELNQIKSEYEQLKINHENMVKEDEEKYNTVDLEVKMLKTENYNLNVMLKEVGNKLQSMETDLNSKETANKGYEFEVQELKNLLKQTKENLQGKEEELRVKTKKMDDLQEALKQIDSIRSSREEKVMFLTEELDTYKATVEEKVREITMTKSELVRLEHENDRLEKDKASLIKALEGFKDSTSSGNKTLIAKYEEIIEMNKKTIEEKDRTINDLRKESNAIKMMFSSREREFEARTSELKHQVEQLTQKNDYLQKDYQQIKLESSNKSEIASKDLTKLKPLAAIADTLVEYSKMALQDVDAAVNALKERVKELITKESQFEIQVAENETLAMKVTELNRVMELQKNQFDELQDVVEKNLKFMNPESSKQDVVGLVSSVNTRELTERSRNTLAKLIQEDIEKNLIIEKRFQYGTQRWCLVANQTVEKLQRKYVIAREEDLLNTPLRAKVMKTEIITLENVDNTHRVTEEVQFVLNEISRQEMAIRQRFELFAAQGVDKTVLRAMQDLMAVNRSLLSRADAIIKRDMKDEEILRILQESEKESDGIRQKCMNLEDENHALHAEIKRLTEGKMRRSHRDKEGNRTSTVEGSPRKEKPKFVIDEENKTISDIQDHPNEQSLSVQKSLGQLDDFLPGSPMSELKDEAIKALENKIGELSATQNKIIQENTDLKKTVEVSEKAIKENESLRFANSQFQIEYERLLEELKDRENDEQRFSMQIQILKKELNDTQTKLKQATSTHEKEHLKKILLKFLDSVLRAEYTKETPELLKILCSLVFCTEAEKNNLLTLLGKLSAQKKQGGGLLKLF